MYVLGFSPCLVSVMGLYPCLEYHVSKLKNRDWQARFTWLDAFFARCGKVVFRHKWLTRDL